MCNSIYSVVANLVCETFIGTNQLLMAFEYLVNYYREQLSLRFPLRWLDCQLAILYLAFGKVSRPKTGHFWNSSTCLPSQRPTHVCVCLFLFSDRIPLPKERVHKTSGSAKKSIFFSFSLSLLFLFVLLVEADQTLLSEF